MTIEATSEKAAKFGRKAKTPPTGVLPIGEVDANIFNCPACARPLGNGVPRCPGCGTRLLAGVQLNRALGFIVGGITVGLLVGGGAMAAVFSTRPAEQAVVEPPAVVTPTQVPVATVAPPAVDPSVPTSALSALRQSTVVNQRILADAERLTLALSGPTPSGRDIAPVLRSIKATAAFGNGIAKDVADWTDGATVSAGLSEFYGSIGTIAADGLTASLRSGAAYASSAERMLAAIASLPELDAASRTLAATADAELPPLDPDGLSAP
jgi:hypothetical protein